MSIACPLAVSGGFVEIPGECMEICWLQMQDASELTAPVQFEDTEPVDHSLNCTRSEVDLGNELVRSAGSTLRQLAQLCVCSNCQADVFTEIYEFRCNTNG